MAHEVESMAYAGEVPWHELGTKIEASADVNGWLEASGLNWEARSVQTFAEIEGAKVRVPAKAIVRMSDKRVLGVSAGNWKPLQNKDLLEFLAEFARATKGKFEAVGSLRNGQKIWGMVKAEGGFTVGQGNNDVVLPYLLFSNSHKPGTAIRIAATSVRVVCANTLALSERTDSELYRQSHIKDFDTDAARDQVKALLADMDIFRQRAETLNNLKLSMDDAVKKVLLPVFMPELLKLESAKLDEAISPQNMPKKIGEILHCIEKSPGATIGNGWGVLNGVTYWADHASGRNAQARLDSAWFGQKAAQKQEVLETLMALC